MIATNNLLCNNGTGDADNSTGIASSRDENASNAKDTTCTEADVSVEVPCQEVVSFFGKAFSDAERFAHMLVREGQLRGVVGPREFSRLWTRHIVNSAAVLPFLPSSGKVVDIGSGAGFPGVVIALLRPDLDVVLVDAMERRARWLREVVGELGLERVTVWRGRAESLGDQFDAVTARAVANLPKLVRLVAPLVRTGGSLVALKGSNAEAEIKRAEHIIKRYHLSIPVIHEVTLPGGEGTRVVEFQRPKKTMNSR